MDAITFRYLIHLAVSEGLEMHLMDVVTAYLYGSIDSDIYMKIPEGFTLPEAKFSLKDLHCLKQIFKTTWYVFNKVATNYKDLYVDDLNLIGTPEGLLETANYLKK